MIFPFVDYTWQSGSPRAEIQARYDAFDRGFRKHDPSVLEHLMTKDFTAESPEGPSLGREATLRAFRGLMMSSKNAKWPRKVVKLTANGQDFVALVSGHFTGQMPGKDGSPHLTELTSTVEDTWTHTEEGWQIRRSHMVKMQMKSDGHVVQQRG